MVQLDHLVVQALLLLLAGREGAPLLQGALDDLHEVLLGAGAGLQDLVDEELPLA